ncbi:MAG TPA: heavy metal-binding domain-containing protein [Thermoanaerobaculia bacterium]|nr:heavy metal-binding domain-containing protein [Thermoanaerobaculia bacterium]
MGQLRIRAVTGLLIVLLAATAAAQRGSAPAMPPLSMTCPMHPDIVEARPGRCPLCKMALVPVRLAMAWMCPLHEAVMREGSGTCPLCRRQLVQVRIAITWTCLAQPGIDRMEAGTCPDGTPRVARRTLRPHGNHNPQHGGQFFMAPDNRHHLEGTYPRARLFRLYVYDDYSRPLAAADLRRVQARVVTRETFDPATKKTTELAAFPLRASRNGAYLEARVDPLAMPAALTAKVRVKPDAPEYRFDFTFPAFTKEPSITKEPAFAAADVDPPAASPTGDSALIALPIPGTIPESTIPEITIPESTIPEIIEQLRTRDEQIRDLIRAGNFSAVWVPAFQAKDLAIALEPRAGHLAPRARESAEPAIQRVVRFAWLLDAFGDAGNRQQLETAYAAFAAALAEVVTAFAGAR